MSLTVTLAELRAIEAPDLDLLVNALGGERTEDEAITIAEAVGAMRSVTMTTWLLAACWDRGGQELAERLLRCTADRAQTYADTAMATADAATKMASTCDCPTARRYAGFACSLSGDAQYAYSRCVAAVRAYFAAPSWAAFIEQMALVDSLTVETSEYASRAASHAASAIEAATKPAGDREQVCALVTP